MPVTVFGLIPFAFMSTAQKGYWNPFYPCIQIFRVLGHLCTGGSHSLLRVQHLSSHWSMLRSQVVGGLFKVSWGPAGSTALGVMLYWWGFPFTFTTAWVVEITSWGNFSEAGLQFRAYRSPIKVLCSQRTLTGVQHKSHTSSTDN